MLRRLPLRWVITFCSLLVSMLIVVGLGGTLYTHVESYVWHITVHRAHTQVAEALRLLDNEDKRPPGLPLTAPADWKEHAADIAAEVGSHIQVCRVVTADGQMLAQAGGPHRHAGPPAPDPSRIVSMLQRFHNSPSPLRPDDMVIQVGTELEPWLICVLPLQRDNQIVGAIEVDSSLRYSEELLDELETYMGWGAVLSVLLSVIMSLWLASLVTRPLERLAETTRKVAAGDLTARTGLEEGRNEVYSVASDFDEMASQVQEAFNAQRRFVADASHELKTPLTAIGGMAEMLRMGADRKSEENRERAIRTIEDQVSRMGRLVSDLLMLSVAEARRQQRREKVSIRELLDECAAYARLAGPKHSINAVIPPPLFVIGDGEQLSRVLHNLLDNALKHTPQGGTVKLSANQENGHVHLRVEDDGSGISKDDLPHIFERFYRADQSRDRQTGGTGLGLSIVQALVEAHHGKVTVDSELGKGTQFDVALPAAPTEDRRQKTEDKS